jgi:pimeloyl-ACP methyl ester carboxylesterase
VTAAAAASDGRREQRAKPTIVLVHRARADSSGWNRVITNPDRRGYPVIAPANPLRGLTSDAAYIRNVLQTISGPIVLVAPSCGGAVITNAAVGVPNVKALVHIAGFTPDAGESLAQLEAINAGTQIGPATLDIRLYPLAHRRTGTDLYLKKSAFRHTFAGDQPLNITDQIKATRWPFSKDAFGSPSGEPARKTIASSYVIATEDHAIAPATQRFMVGRIHAAVVDVKASHVAIMSQPEPTIRLIVNVAEAVA